VKANKQTCMKPRRKAAAVNRGGLDDTVSIHYRNRRVATVAAGVADFLPVCAARLVAAALSQMGRAIDESAAMRIQS
jgi:hypothetical protein